MSTTTTFDPKLYQLPNPQDTLNEWAGERGKKPEDIGFEFVNRVGESVELDEKEPMKYKKSFSLRTFLGKPFAAFKRAVM